MAACWRLSVTGPVVGRKPRHPCWTKQRSWWRPVILAIAAFMVMLDITGNCKDKDVVFWVGKDSWRTDLGLRLSGIGTPALAHIAAALAFAISSKLLLIWEKKKKIKRDQCNILYWQKIFFFFWKKFLLLTKAAFIWSKNAVKTVKFITI